MTSWYVIWLQIGLAQCPTQVCHAEITEVLDMSIPGFHVFSAWYHTRDPQCQPAGISLTSSVWASMSVHNCRQVPAKLSPSKFRLSANQHLAKLDQCSGTLFGVTCFPSTFTGHHCHMA